MTTWTQEAVDRRFEQLLERVRRYRPEADLEVVRRAYQFASQVHDVQLRQSGEPYILHPIAACEILADIEADEDALAACLLHDTVEDCMQDEERQLKLARAERDKLQAAGKRGQAARLTEEIESRERFVEKVKDEVQDNLNEQFGPTIRDLVAGVTRLSEVRFFDQTGTRPQGAPADGDEDSAAGAARRQLQAENLRRMVVAAAKDVRVLIIKLADRLHNMQTLYAKRRPKQIKIARETELLYAKLADRMGIWRIKWEMEDLAFRYLSPEAFFELERRVARTREERQAEIDAVVRRIENAMERAGVEAEVYGRPKHLASIYGKMKRQGIDFDDILDLEGLRVITQSIPACYEALGIIHSLWPHQAEHFSDYISRAKPNGYRSIHTKVIVPGHGPMEVQIRTEEMHRQAEYGIAAHWRYKEDGSIDEAFANKLSIMRQLFEMAKSDNGDPEAEESDDFLRAVEAHLAEEEVFVYTPKGEVVPLPRGATVVDFAYRIHTEVGHTCIGAKVNRRIVPLDYPLRNGDQVEILRQRNTGPSKDWLKFVATATARNRIRQYWRQKERESLMERGQQLLEEEAERRKIDLNELYRRDRELPAAHRRRAPDQPVEDVLARVARRRSVHTPDDLLTAIGAGKASAEGVLHQMTQDLDDAYRAAGLLAPEDTFELVGRPTAGPRDEAAVSFQGIDNLMYRRSKCCLPVPGDAIGGYITRGQGIAIHRLDCPNFRHLGQKEPGRITTLDWQQTESVLYDVPLEVKANDRIGLLRDLAGLMSELGINILSANTLSPRFNAPGSHHIATVRLGLELVDRSQIEELVKRLPALGAVKVTIRGQVFLDTEKGTVRAPVPPRHAASRR